MQSALKHVHREPVSDSFLVTWLSRAFTCSPWAPYRCTILRRLETALLPLLAVHTQVQKVVIMVLQACT